MAVGIIPYNQYRTRILELNKASKWELTAGDATHNQQHPFHIHVNPFQLTRKGPDGNPEIVWKDTLLVTTGDPLEIRSRYLDFDGKFVLHCHILTHEDQGMMELVQIVK